MDATSGDLLRSGEGMDCGGGTTSLGDRFKRSRNDFFDLRGVTVDPAILLDRYQRSKVLVLQLPAAIGIQLLEPYCCH
jgi:hypothetical protein